MRTILTILLIALSLSVSGQLKTPYLYYTFENNYADSSGNEFDATAYGDGVSLSSSVKKFGSYSLYLNGSDDYIKTPTISLSTDSTEGWLISFWALTSSNITTDRIVFCAADSSTTTNNFSIKGMATNLIRPWILNSADNSITWSSGSWHNVIIYTHYDGTNYVARAWYDGERSASTDSIMGTTCDYDTRYNIGCDFWINGDFVGYIDEFVVWQDLEPTEAQIDSIFVASYKSSGAPDPYAYNPTSGRHVRFLSNGVEVRDKPRPSGFHYWLAKVPILSINLDLVHDQNFLSYSGAAVNDYVGTIRPNANWDTLSTLTYELVSDASGLFSLVGDNIVFSSVSGLQKSHTYEIEYKISDGAYYDIATGYVYVADADSCVLIATDGSGDYTSWSSVDNNFTEGYYYLQRRGSTINTTYEITINASNVTIGAYGEGAYPIVNYTPTATTSTFSSWYYEGLTMRDIEVRNYTYDALIVVNFDNIAGQYTTIDNCVFTRQRFINFHRGNNLRVFNCQIYDIMCDGILIGGVDNIEVAYNAIYDINKYYNYNSVPMSGSTPAYYGDGIQIEPFSPSDGYTGYTTNDDAWVHHNYIDKNDTNKAVILYGSYDGTGNITIEYNRFIASSDPNKNTNVFYFAENDAGNRQDTGIFRYNVVDGGDYLLFQAGGSEFFDMSYNLIKDIVQAGMFSQVTDSVLVYNNTFYNSQNAGDMFYSYSSGIKLKLRNNIFYLDSDVDIRNVIGTCSSDYNIYYPNATNRDITLGAHDIEGDPLLDSNLRLSIGSPCVNAGTNLGFTKDLFGNNISGLPDMGAYEQ